MQIEKLESKQMTLNQHQCSACAKKRDRFDASDIIADAASPNTHSNARRKAVLEIRKHICEFIRTHGVGHEFQSVDFTHWMKQQPRTFDLESIDLRSIGGMILNLTKSGIIESIGIKNNGGDRSSNYHGTPRKVYRVVCTDITKLGWLDSDLLDKGIIDDAV